MLNGLWLPLCRRWGWRWFVCVVGWLVWGNSPFPSVLVLVSGARNIVVIGSGNTPASSSIPLLSSFSASGWQVMDTLAADVQPSGTITLISFTVDMAVGSSTAGFALHSCSKSSATFTCSAVASSFALPNTGLNTYAATGTLTAGNYFGLAMPAGSSGNYPMIKENTGAGSTPSYWQKSGSGSGAYTASSNSDTMAITLYICQTSGSNNPNNCASTTCPAVSLTKGAVAYSQVPATTGPFVIGTVATFTCSSPYSVVGSSTSTCLYTGGLVFTVPSCRCYCAAATLNNGGVSYSAGSPYIDGTVATFTCNNGYYMTGSSTSTCGVVSGTCQFVVPTCNVVACAAVSSYANGIITYTPAGSAPYPYSTIASYGCTTGYYYSSGVSSSTCDNTNAFNPLTPTPTCSAITCAAAPISNGVVSYSQAGPPYPYGTVATYTCNAGNYQMVGSATTTCLDQVNQFTAPTCQYVTCADVSAGITNGGVTYNLAPYDSVNKLYSIGTVATFTCNSGYFMRGASTSTCTFAASAFLIPTCSTTQACATPTFPNGPISYSSAASSVSSVASYYDVGVVATFSCYAGYTLSGSSTSTCTTSGSVTQFASVPTCVVITCGAVSGASFANGVVSYSSSSPYPYSSTATFTCNTNYGLVFSEFTNTGTTLTWNTNSASAPCLTGTFETPKCSLPDIYAFPALTSDSSRSETRLTGATPGSSYVLFSHTNFVINTRFVYLSAAPSGGCPITWTACWNRPQSYIDAFALRLSDQTNFTCVAANYATGAKCYYGGSLFSGVNTYISLTGLNSVTALNGSYLYAAATAGVITKINLVLGPLIVAFTHSDSFFNIAWHINSTTMTSLGTTPNTMSAALSQGSSASLLAAVRSAYGVNIASLPTGVINMHGILGQSWLNVAYTNVGGVNNAIQGVIDDYKLSSLSATSFAYSLATFT